MFNDQLSSPKIYHTSRKVWFVLLSALLARNLHSFILVKKNLKLTNEIGIKCITWAVTNSHMLDGKADGFSQWFLSRLA